jgi:acyl-CoA reductase-like NAD-dependent aldehyde dehydrogenase
MVNGGQSCIAAKRFIIPKNISAEFGREMSKAMSELVVGNPMDPSTQVGPLARKDLVDYLRGQVSRSIRMGAHVLFKHSCTPRKGFFYPPTLLSHIQTGMPVFFEETFGPVAGIIPADSPAHAIELANMSEYGLGASLWSSNVMKAESFARRIQSGNVFVNKNVVSDPRIGFGGTKQSGLGKELGELGIKEFTNAKTIWIN